MNPETTQSAPLNKDEDVTFEQEKEPAMAPVSAVAPQKGIGETTLPDKEETLGHSDFPPLTDEDKQPKLPAQE